MGKTAKTILKCVGFLLLLALAVAGIQRLFGLGDYSIYSRERGFKQEKRGSLDAVYIGASHVFSFYEPPLAWEDYGIAVFDYAIPSMPACALKYRVIEARKTQPDALYIINLNCFKSSETGIQASHRSLDYMPWSLNKIRMLNTMLDRAEIAGADRLEYYLPIIRFHSGWPDLTHSDFVHPVNGLKGAYSYGPFLKSVTDITGSYTVAEGQEELTPEQAEDLDALLDYCDREQVKVLFVLVPQVLEEEVQGQIHTIEDIVLDRGYDCLDLMDALEAMGIQPEIDYNDKKHLNIHGAVKFTDYVAEYLVENYGFTDKRGEAGWDSWDKSVELYTDVIGPYTLPLERENAARNYDLAIPALDTPRVEGQTITLSWSETEGAEGYEIYCKSKIEAGGYWYYLAAVEDGLSYVDEEGLAAETTYTYTVVPYDTAPDGTVRYGNFDYAGVSGKTEG